MTKLDKFVASGTIDQGNILIKSYINDARGLIRYDYYENGDGLLYSYLSYTNEEAKRRLESEGIETYDGGCGTFGVRIPGGGSQLLFGPSVKAVNEIIESSKELKRNLEFEWRQDNKEKFNPLSWKDWGAVLLMIVVLSLLYYIFS